MLINRHKTKVVKIGNVAIGGKNPVAIQSMAKAKTADIDLVVKQIKQLEALGCEIVRLAIKDFDDAKALKNIKPLVKIPLVADIHFNYKLAIGAIENGVDKIRLNPGNIYKRNEIREVVAALKAFKIPLRIGLNSGSVRAGSSAKTSMPDKLVSQALEYIKVVESFKFYEIVISLKASNVLDTVEAYRKMAKQCGYPLHLGVTATGPFNQGAVKSSIAIGSLLIDGIGDTIRVSLTDESAEEIKVAKTILEALEVRSFGPEIISCPTCGRCEVDLVDMVKDFTNKLNAVNSKPLTVNSQPVRVAIMGCVVNGPGEAKEADIGIAFGKKEGLLFKKGKPVKKISSGACVEILLEEIVKFNK